MFHVPLLSLSNCVILFRETDALSSTDGKFESAKRGLPLSSLLSNDSLESSAPNNASLSRSIGNQ